MTEHIKIDCRQQTLYTSFSLEKCRSCMVQTRRPFGLRDTAVTLGRGSKTTAQDKHTDWRSIFCLSTEIFDSGWRRRTSTYAPRLDKQENTDTQTLGKSTDTDAPTWHRRSHVTGVHLWVIETKKPMILCARSTSRSREQSKKHRWSSENMWKVCLF